MNINIHVYDCTLNSGTHSGYVGQKASHVICILTPADVKIRPSTGIDATIPGRSRCVIYPCVFGHRPGNTRQLMDRTAGDRLGPLITTSVSFGDYRSAE